VNREPRVRYNMIERVASGTPRLVEVYQMKTRYVSYKLQCGRSKMLAEEQNTNIRKQDEVLEYEGVYRQVLGLSRSECGLICPCCVPSQRRFLHLIHIITPSTSF
jgi:hypothetical protein